MTRTEPIQLQCWWKVRVSNEDSSLIITVEDADASAILICDHLVRTLDALPCKDIMYFEMYSQDPAYVAENYSKLWDSIHVINKVTEQARARSSYRVPKFGQRLESPGPFMCSVFISGSYNTFKVTRF